MNIDKLKAEWRRQLEHQPDEQLGLAKDAVIDKANRIESTLLRRDIIEIVSAVVVIGVFAGFLYITPGPPLIQFGVYAIISAALVVIGVLIWARKANARPHPTLPVAKFCQAEAKRLHLQMYLLRHSTWWYGGPLMLGCVLFIFAALYSVPELGAATFYGFLFAFCCCFFAAGRILRRAHHRAAAELAPIRDEFKALAEALDIEDLDDDAESGENSTAS